MADSTYLMGAEDVRRAGAAMQEAAADMRAAAANLEGALERHQRFMDDWLARFAALLEAMTKPVILVESKGPSPLPFPRDG